MCVPGLRFFVVNVCGLRKNIADEFLQLAQMRLVQRERVAQLSRQVVRFLVAGIRAILNAILIKQDKKTL